MYGHILYIDVSEIRTPISLFLFFGSCFLKLRNALGNEKIANSEFGWIRSLMHIKAVVYKLTYRYVFNIKR